MINKIQMLRKLIAQDSHIDEFIDKCITALETLSARNLSGDDNNENHDAFDPEFNHTVLLPTLETVFEKWFRGQVIGTQYLPACGGGLIVANHAGVLPVDALMLTAAVHNHKKRDLRVLAADLVFQLPVVSALAYKTGYTPARMSQAQELLEQGQLVSVFPEGYKGLGKPYRDRYKLQRFGRGGFVSVALRTQVPIIPCAIVGSEEIYPMIADVKPLARLLELPYFPITPLFPLAGPLGLVPLPSKWTIIFGPPIKTTSYNRQLADDPLTVFELADNIRNIIQQMLYQNLIQRTNMFSN